VRQLVRRRRLQLPIPGSQRAAQVTADSGQRGDLPIDGLEQALRPRAHVVTRLAARVAHPQEAGNLMQRESEPLRVPHDRQPIDDPGSILPVARGRSRRFRQQADSLVVANRVGRDAGTARDLSDVHRLPPALGYRRLDPGVDSKV